MSDELTRNDSEESVCDCRSSAWVSRTGGWYCCHCGQWQCTITGRVSIRDPEPFHDLKPLSRGHVGKPFTPSDRTKDPFIACDLSEIDYALFEAFTNDWEPKPDGCGDT
jgi:hypothetical protein